MSLSSEEIASIVRGNVLQLHGNLRYIVAHVDGEKFICHPLNERQQKDGIYIWSARQFAKYEWEILLKSEDTYPHENL